jgi:hypothetical protein
MNFNILPAVIFSLLFLAACQGTLEPQNNHEAKHTDNTTTIAENESKAKINSFDSFNQIDNEDLFFEKSKDLFFSISTWQNESLTKTPQFTTWTDKFIKILLTKNIDNQIYWQQSKNLILQLCPLQSETCQAIIPLKGQARSGLFLETLAKKTSELEQHFHFIFLAFDLQNNTYSPSLIELFTQRAVEYKNYLQANISTVKNSEKLKILNSFSQSILDLGKNGKIQNPNPAWSKEFTPNSVIDIGAQQKNSGSLSSKMKWIESINPHLLNKNDKVELPIDSYVFLLEQIFNGNISATEAVTSLNKENLKKDQMLSKSYQYIQLQMKYLVALAQNDMKSFSEKYKTQDRTRLFLEFKKYNDRSINESRIFKEKVIRVVQFANRLDSDSILSNKLMLAASEVEKTIKINITYPQMIILLYYTGIMGTNVADNIQLELGIESTKAPFGYIVNALIIGRLRTLFNYTIDFKTLNTLEIIQSFDSIFKNQYLSILNIKADDLLTLFFETLLKQPIEYERIGRSLLLQNSQDNLNAKYISSEWKDTQSFCKALSNQMSITRTLPIQEIILSPTLGSLKTRLNSTFEGTEISGKVPVIEKGYFGASTKHSRMLEIIRLDFFNLLRVFTILKQSAIENDTTNATLPSTEKSLNLFKDRISQFVTQLNARNQDFEKCYFTLMNRERQLITKIIQYENLYWRNIHSQIKNQNDKTQANVATANSALDFALPNKVQWRTNVSQNRVVTYPTDFLFRVKNYLQFGLKTGAKNYPALDEKLKIEIDSGFANNSIYLEAQPRSIPFNNNEDDYVNSIINSQFYTGFINWFQKSYFSTVNFQFYLDTAAQLYRLGPGLNEILALEPIKKINELVAVPFQIIKFLNITPEEQSLFQSLGISSRYSMDVILIGKLLLKDSQQANASLDYLLNTISSPWMGHWGDKSFWENPLDPRSHRPYDLIPLNIVADNLNQLVNYSKINFASEQTTKEKSKINSLIESTYKKAIENDLQLMSDFKKYVVTNYRNASPFKLQLETTQTYEVPVVSESAIEDVESKLILFNTKTNGYFKVPLDTKN